MPTSYSKNKTILAEFAELPNKHNEN